MKINIGSSDGKPVYIDLKTLLPTRLLIQANSGGGKSFLLRRLAEQFFGHVQVIIIDPEGEFSTLRERFGYVLVGEGGETPADPRSAVMLAERLLELNASAVCDLYEAFRSRPNDRRQWVRYFLNGLLDAPRKLWRPLIVMVDEAHKFCPQETPKAASMQEREIISECKGAMIGMATTGRKRGFCPIWATQRLAKLDKDASAEMFNRLVGMTIEDVDVDRAADLMSVSKEEKHDFRVSLRTLVPGQFYGFGRAIATERILIKVGPVVTRHPEGGIQKNFAPPPAPSSIKDLLPKLADLPKEVETKAKTEAELRTEVRMLTKSLQEAKKQSGAVDPAQVEKAVQAALGKQERSIRPILEDIVKLIAEINLIGIDGKVNESELKSIMEGASKHLVVIAEKLISARTDKLERIKKESQSVMTRLRKILKEDTLTLQVNVTKDQPRKFTEVKGPVAPVRWTNPPGDPEKFPQNGDVKLSSTERRALGILCQWPNGLSEGQLAAQLGIKARGGNWQNLKSHLNVPGFIEKSGKILKATSRGVGFIGHDIPPAPSSTKEVLAVWNGVLASRAYELLTVLVDAGGEPVDEDEAAGRLGVKALGGNWQNLKSQLRTAGLLVSSGGRQIAANKENLFL